MNTSYKIALGAAVLLCVLVVGYSLMSESPPKADDGASAPAPTDNRLAVNSPTRPLTLERPEPSAPTSTVPAPPANPSPSTDSSSPDSPASDLYARALRARLAAEEKSQASPEVPPASDSASASAGTAEVPSAPTLAAANTPSDASIGEGDGPTPAPATYVVGSSSPPSIPPADPGVRSVVANVPAAPVMSDAVTSAPPAASSPGNSPSPGSTTPPASPAGNQYTIKSGDTFARIAIEQYGDESKWVDIAQANPLVDPRKLKIGQVIRLPSPAELRAAAAPPPPTAPGAIVSGTTYVIRNGDTLSSIAQRFYGDRTLADHIHRANLQVIGPDPDQISAGDKIVIPPKP